MVRQYLDSERVACGKSWDSLWRLGGTIPAVIYWPDETDNHMGMRAGA